MFHKDWLVRQLQIMSTAIGNIVFNKEIVATYELKGGATQSDTDLLFVLLCSLVEKRNINEAENLLFDMLDTDNHDHLVLATDFYKRLNGLTDKELENADFTREEIADGLGEICSIFGLSDL
jgi:hypothetical protein